jgi:hypothetical protein
MEAHSKPGQERPEGEYTMRQRLLFAALFVASFTIAVQSTSGSADARIFGRRAPVGTYFYYNGPPRAFYGPPIRVHSSAWDIGPYGPGYGWMYRRPVGPRVIIGY